MKLEWSSHFSLLPKFLCVWPIIVEVFYSLYLLQKSALLCCLQKRRWFPRNRSSAGNGTSVVWCEQEADENKSQEKKRGAGTDNAGHLAFVHVVVGPGLVQNKQERIPPSCSLSLLWWFPKRRASPALLPLSWTLKPEPRSRAAASEKLLAEVLGTVWGVMQWGSRFFILAPSFSAGLSLSLGLLWLSSVCCHRWWKTGICSLTGSLPHTQT